MFRISKIDRVARTSDILRLYSRKDIPTSVTVYTGGIISHRERLEWEPSPRARWKFFFLIRVILRGQAQYGGVFPLSIYSFIPVTGKKKRYLIDKIYCGTPVSIAEQIYLLCGQQPSPSLPSLNLGSAVSWNIGSPPDSKVTWQTNRCTVEEGEKKRDGPYGVSRPVNFSAFPANNTKHTYALSFDLRTSVSLIALASGVALEILRRVIAFLFNLTQSVTRCETCVYIRANAVVRIS